MVDGEAFCRSGARARVTDPKGRRSILNDQYKKGVSSWVDFRGKRSRDG